VLLEAAAGTASVAITKNRKETNVKKKKKKKYIYRNCLNRNTTSQRAKLLRFSFFSFLFDSSVVAGQTGRA
jgi:hypothetical protein